MEISKGLNLNEEQVFESTEIEFSINHKKYIIGVLYRSPNEQNLNSFLEKLDMYIDTLEPTERELIIAADFNINTLENNTATRKFHDIIHSHGLSEKIQISTRVTGETETCIDNFVTNISKTKGGVIEALISDHHAISLELPVTNVLEAKITQKVRKIDNESLQELKARLKRSNWDDVYEGVDINVKYDKFMSTFSYCYNIACPMTTKKTKQLPKNRWNNRAVKIAKDKMFEKYSMWKTSKSARDKDIYNHYRKSYKTTIIESKSGWMQDSLTNSENKSKTAWEIVNKERSGKTKEQRNVTLIENNKKTINPSQVAEIFNSFFANISSAVNCDNVSNTYSEAPPNSNPNQHQLQAFTEVTENTVSKILSNFKPKKSSGMDEVSMKVLKCCQEEILAPFTHIINCSIGTGVFPKSFKIAKVRPIHKKGSVVDKNNYRPISLLSSFSKVLEKVVCEQLTQYLESFLILNIRQYGFRKGKSTKLAIIDFLNKCIDAVEAGETVLGCFADLTKAFDCVDITLLLKKLENSGIVGLALEWFRSYLNGRSQVTEIYNKTKSKIRLVRSEPEPVPAGVPQGSVLGPVLFLIYINDITNSVPIENLFQFADDTTLFVRSNTCEELEVESFGKVNDLAQFFLHNQLKLNPSKTNYICIQTHQKKNSVNNSLPNLFIGEEQLEMQNSAGFLGVKLDDTLSWHEQVDCVTAKLAKGLYVLRTFKKYGNEHLSRIIYFSLFETHLSYSIIFWGTFKSHINETFIWQKKAIRALAGLEPQAHCHEAFTKLGILTVPSLFIYEAVMYIRLHKKQTLEQNNQKHRYNTRFKNNFAQQHRLSMYEKKPEYIGTKLYQELPKWLTSIRSDKIFKNKLKDYLVDMCFYSVEEFLQH